MKTRTAQKNETHEQLLAKAAELFASRGVARTTTADVARAAGVSHGSVFVHFPSRDALVVAVAGRLGRAITDRLHALASDGGTLRSALAVHLKCIEEHEALYRRLLVEQDALPIEAREAWIGIQSAVSFHILQVAEREMAEGRVRKVPLHLVFNGWIGLVHHYLANRDLFTRKASVLRVHGPMLIEHYSGLLSR